MLPHRVRPRRDVELSSHAETFLTSLGFLSGSWTGPLKRLERETLSRWRRRERGAARPLVCQSRILLGKAGCIDGRLFWKDAFAFRRPGEIRAYLEVDSQRFRFRETINDRAELMIYDQQLPESALVSIKGSGLRLCQLVQLEGWFFETGDPLVLSASNRQDWGSPVVILRLKY